MARAYRIVATVPSPQWTALPCPRNIEVTAPWVRPLVDAGTRATVPPLPDSRPVGAIGKNLRHGVQRNGTEDAGLVSLRSDQGRPDATSPGDQQMESSARRTVRLHHHPGDVERARRRGVWGSLCRISLTVSSPSRSFGDRLVADDFDPPCPARRSYRLRLSVFQCSARL